MLRSRIIPCLLVHNGGLVKTVGFGKPKYVGDPINAVKIFNEKAVDELIVMDIDASVRGVAPDFRLIENLASECRMPLCYGGGISSVEQAEQIVSLGVEKVALSSALLQSPELASQISQAIGTQSVVLVLDVKKSMLGRYSVWTHNGTRNLKMDPFVTARSIAAHGVGEIVVNSIEKDGTLSGYDMQLIERMREAVDVPITALGGAGSMDDIHRLVDRFRIIGAAAGSLFVFKGKYRAVLISYPNADEKKRAAAVPAAA